MSQESIQTLAFISWMAITASASTSCSVYEFDSIVRGHHIYKTIWTPVSDEMLQVAWEDTNEHGEYYAIAITRGGRVVGHIPWEISRICSFSLIHGTISCRITGTEEKQLV